MIITLKSDMDFKLGIRYLSKCNVHNAIITRHQGFNAHPQV